MLRHEGYKLKCVLEQTVDGAGPCDSAALIRDKLLLEFSRSAAENSFSCYVQLKSCETSLYRSVIHVSFSLYSPLLRSKTTIFLKQQVATLDHRMGPAFGIIESEKFPGWSNDLECIFLIANNRKITEPKSIGVTPIWFGCYCCSCNGRLEWSAASFDDPGISILHLLNAELDLQIQLRIQRARYKFVHHTSTSPIRDSFFRPQSQTLVELQMLSAAHSSIS